MDWYQCDQMLKIKSSHSNFYFEIMFSLRPKVTFGLLFKKICHKEFSKIALSGRVGGFVQYRT